MDNVSNNVLPADVCLFNRIDLLGNEIKDERTDVKQQNLKTVYNKKSLG